MRVRELMTSAVHTCTPQDTLEHAARLLWEHDCGVLPVVDQQGRAGATITDRDICMGAWTRGAPLAALRVRDSMSRDLTSCRPEDEVTVAARKMRERGVRRLPVVDAEGKVCGLLSLNDLARAARNDEAIGREALATLSAVCSRQERAVAAPPAKPQRPGGASARQA